MSPTLFREYGNDIPACMSIDYDVWKKGELEDLADLISNDSSILLQSKRSPISIQIDEKKEDEKSKEELWDEHLRSSANGIEYWRIEKTGIGPEPELVPHEKKNTAEASVYADDNSAGEEAENVAELKVKTEEMLLRS